MSEPSSPEHQFDHVTRYCIYCGASLADYFFHKTPCTRLIEPVPQEPIEE